MKHLQNQSEETDEAARQLCKAAAASKCWRCGCLHGALDAIEADMPAERRSTELIEAISQARSRLTNVQYDCLGCEVCYPAIALDVLGIEAVTCPSDAGEEREGWPPLPGTYLVAQYHAPVAVCTLTDETLMHTLSSQELACTSLIGTMQTENLGIERLIRNVLANPNIRFVVLCGEDSRQRIGHQPGASLLALARNGLDDNARIIDALGKRPFLRNLSRETIEHFRRTIEIVDLVGEQDTGNITATVRECAARNPGPAEPCPGESSIQPMHGYVPNRMKPDPAGYVVVYVDRRQNQLLLEHYQNDGVLDVVIVGRNAAEVCSPAIERGLVSQLDHAVYLGRELARAEHALRTGHVYVQDAAPERPARQPVACGCTDSCGGGS